MILGIDCYDGKKGGATMLRLDRWFTFFATFLDINTSSVHGIPRIGSNTMEIHSSRRGRGYSEGGRREEE